MTTTNWCPKCGGSHEGIDLCKSCFQEQLKSDYCLVCGYPVSEGTCMNTDCARQDLQCRQEGVAYTSMPPVT